MTEPVPISEAFATGEEIGPIVANIEAAIDGVPRTHALIALTSLLLLLQHPTITQEQVYEGVKDISRFVCLYLSGVDEGSAIADPTDKSQMN